MTISRRKFIQNTGALSVAGLVAPSIIRAQNLRGQKLRIAVIGVGGRGTSHVKGLSGEEYVAFCDVDEKRAAKTFSKYPNVPRFKDFRVMFDKMGSQIDAVSIAVPDHMHYPIALWAMANGKHVLCEKPLVRTFEEAMLLKQAAKESGVITQMGNQGHANDGLRDIEEWVNAGIIGEVEEVYHWTNRPVWPQGMKSWPNSEPVPNTIDWNLWQGVAPEKAFSSDIAPFKWRGFKMYGAGAIGDIACHAMDGSYTPLRLGFPTKVWSDSVANTQVAFPKQSSIFFEFAAKGGRGPIKLTWMDGGRRPKDVPFVPNEFILENRETNKKGQANGTILVGTKGAIFADMYAKAARVFPNDYFRQLRMDKALPAKTLPRVGKSHFREWIACAKAGKQPGSNIADYAADFTGTALLGAASLQFDSVLEFDATTLKFTNNTSANQYLKSQYDYRKEFLVS
ncbi:MAG: Gfo/Idh/MocA family oxidoreductase [Verrucomicrobiota bacterium]